MTLRVAVDFGTSSTCVVASINGREPQVVVVDGQPLMSSAVYAAADGTLFVGQEAERQAAMDPSRYEPHPKRRIDEGELLLGDSVLRVLDVVHAVLERAVSEARRLAGGADVDLLVLTHPADWGAVRTRLLRQAAGRLAHEVALVPEPVAAAVFHAATFAAADVNQERTVEFSGRPGDTLAVLDLGGGTVDVSVVTRAPSRPGAFSGLNAPGDQGGRRGGFQVLATRGDPSWGGADVDQALLEHVGGLVSSADPDAWRQLVEGRELADRRRRRVLHQDVRGAKETLSRHAYTDVPMPPPFSDAHVTREDLERLIAARLGRTVELTVAAVDDAGLRPQQLTAIFLVGGSSRIPMVSRLTHERTGVVPTTLDQPETVVARGALRAVQVDSDRTGALPGTAAPRPGAPRSPGEQRTEVVRPGDVPRPAFTPPRPPAPPGAFSPLNAPRGGPQGGRPLVASPPRGVPAAAAVVPEGGRKRPGKVPWLVGGAVLLVAAAAAVLVVVLNKDEPPPLGRLVAQYDYRFSVPTDWVQTGSDIQANDVQDRRVVVRPDDAQTGPDLVSVQEYLLDYDASADRARWANELRGSAERAGPEYSGFNPELGFAGKTTVYYRQVKTNWVVDWYVVAKGDVQVNVGCQYAAAIPRERVLASCEQIVRTLEITR
ncbi:type VII secretion-associated protein [Amycolatopsis nigrescens]|uniref:type VII secretion-associated protein n=1 Tax=Amycolatopsis nigrescens TaxID=381445 RepID=UPI000476775F|nr:type VII secretion-associated protein [Amycolatopsis nigrescens]